jgi:hypothetical protein
METIFKNTSLLFFLVLVSGIVNSQEKNDVITRLKAQLFLNSTWNATQTITLQTDKSLYRPGEEIWIAGYVTDALTRQASSKSHELTVQLLDYKGNIMNSNKFMIQNGMASGFLKTPLFLTGNLYTLVATTPEMGKVSPANLSGNDIYLCRPENIGMIPKIEYADKMFPKGSEVKAFLKLTDYSGKPLTGKKFDYKISSNNKVLASGKCKTTESGSAEIDFNPGSIEPNSPLMIDAEIPNGGEKINFVSHIPLASEKIDVRFFPEGGKIVPGIPQRVVFEAKDQLGNPVNVDAEILSDKGESLAKTTKIQTGLGLFSMIIPENSGYKLRINSESGKGQETLLPPADTSGMSISVRKTDARNMELLLARSPGSKHSKFLIVSLNRGEITWANEFELEQAGIIKVPLDNFESEIGVLAIFNQNGTLAGERLVYAGKKKGVDVSVLHDKSGYSVGEKADLIIKLSGQDGKPVKGVFSISLVDKTACPVSEDIFNALNSGLENPENLPEGEMNDALLNTYLIANHIKGVDWTKILTIDPAKPQALKSDAPMKAFQGEIPIHGKVNEWKFLEAFQQSGYFKENPDFFKTGITGKKVTENEANVPAWKKYLESGGNVLDAIKMIHPYDSRDNKIIFHGLNSFSNQDGALIVIDGQKLGVDASYLAQLNPTTIENLRILLDPQDIVQYTGFNAIGVIEITTKRGPSMNNESVNQDLHLPSEGLFTPKPIGNKKYNLLTTLQWIPDLRTNDNGEVTIKFSTGNIKSTFLLKIAGHTEKGECFEKQKEIPVK